MRIIENLIKKEVLNHEIKVMGKVNDVAIDEDTLEMTDLIVKKTGLTESIKSNSENVIPIDMIKTIGDKIILKGDDDI